MIDYHSSSRHNSDHKPFPDYVVLVGSGRSGTNWLLQLFDLSPSTFCRNEPGQIASSPLHPLLKEKYFLREEGSQLSGTWDEAIRWTVGHMGERDQPIVRPKEYIRGISQRLSLGNFILKRRIRRVLGYLHPELGESEWPLPWWLGSELQRSRALPVLKCGHPGWMEFVLPHRPNVNVFHIIRHPGGYLNSWRKRVLKRYGEERLLSQNLTRLNEIANAKPIWRSRFGDIQSMDVYTSELWYWLYFNEVIFELGNNFPQYQTIIFEDLASDPTSYLRSYYDQVGLEWSERIKNWTVELCGDSTQIATDWQNQLSVEHRELAKQFSDRFVLGSSWNQKIVA